VERRSHNGDAGSPCLWGRRRFLAGAAWLAGGGAFAATRRPNQYQLHAALILKFSTYVTEWPKELAPGKEISLCVVTRSRSTLRDFASEIDGESSGGRTWRVVQARSLTEAIGHRFVYIDAERPAPDDLWYQKARIQGVLTVGEKVGSKDCRCAIEFEARKFDIDLEMVERAGIRLHSDLFEIARSVRRVKL